MKASEELEASVGEEMPEELEADTGAGTVVVVVEEHGPVVVVVEAVDPGVPVDVVVEVPGSDVVVAVVARREIGGVVVDVVVVDVLVVVDVVEVLVVDVVVLVEVVLVVLAGQTVVVVDDGSVVLVEGEVDVVVVVVVLAATASGVTEQQTPGTWPGATVVVVEVDAVTEEGVGVAPAARTAPKDSSAVRASTPEATPVRRTALHRIRSSSPRTRPANRAHQLVAPRHRLRLR